jgi:hypothetical protein
MACSIPGGAPASNPLIEWGWDRARCQDYIAEVTGRTSPWEKSACGFCVFAMSTAAGRSALVARYRREPATAAHALFVEHVARCLNPRQTLITGSSAADLVADAGLHAVLGRFHGMLDAAEHAVYRVRRLTRPSSRRPGRAGITARCVQEIVRGSRQHCAAALATMPGAARVGVDGIIRHVVRDRADRLPLLEELYVACPAVVDEKARPGFETWWTEATSRDVLF